MITAAIVGVTGYEGMVLARLLTEHPHIRLTEVISRAEVGHHLGDALPSLSHSAIAHIPITEHVEAAELIFLAVPHGPAAAIAAECRRAGRIVIDLSADFRLHSLADYEFWYKQPHAAPELLESAVYGLCEYHRAALRTTDLIANPGCFPTTAILAMAPAVEADLITPDIIVDAKTGISGAGRSPSRRSLFVETHDSIAPYGLGGHRHAPEMEQELTALAARDAVHVTFVPHLVPMNRGLLATCYATLRPGVTIDAVRAAYEARYADEPFITISDHPPETGWVRGSNRCMMHLAVDAHANRLIVVAAIDNLMKGGAGQAIQCANIRLGFDETAGLAVAGVWP